MFIINLSLDPGLGTEYIKKSRIRFYKSGSVTGHSTTSINAQFQTLRLKKIFVAMTSVVDSYPDPDPIFFLHGDGLENGACLAF